MTQVTYYHAGRGLVRLSQVTAEAVEAGMLQALHLVDREAAGQQHRVLRWYLGADTSFARCVRCGHTVVVTRCRDLLFIDSCAHTRCRPTESTAGLPRLAVRHEGRERCAGPRHAG